MIVENLVLLVCYFFIIYFKDIIIFLINAQNAQKLAYHVIIVNVLPLIANLINMELKILINAIIVLKAVKNAMGLMIMTAYLAIAIFIYKIHSAKSEVLIFKKLLKKIVIYVNATISKIVKFNYTLAFFCKYNISNYL